MPWQMTEIKNLKSEIDSKVDHAKWNKIQHSELSTYCPRRLYRLKSRAPFSLVCSIPVCVSQPKGALLTSRNCPSLEGWTSGWKWRENAWKASRESGCGRRDTQNSASSSWRCAGQRGRLGARSPWRQKIHTPSTVPPLVKNFLSSMTLPNFLWLISQNCLRLHRVRLPRALETGLVIPFILTWI